MADLRPVTQLAAAIEALEILGPTRYAWLGEAFDLPEPVRRLAPPDGLRAALVHAVQWRLYADFFTAGAPTPPPARITRSRDRQLAAGALGGQRGNGHDDPGWWFVGFDDGRLIVERLGLHMWAAPEEVAPDVPGPLRGGDPVAVRMPSEAPNFSPGFYMAFSDRGLDPDRPRLLDRYYLHVRAGSAVRCVELATTRLNAADLPFRLKVVDEPASFGRCDSAVLALQRKDRDAALHHVRELHQSLGPGLDARVPALTLRLAPGLGFAEDPAGGVSFGAHRCRLIAAALVEAHEAGLTAARRPDGGRASPHGRRGHDPRGAVPGSAVGGRAPAAARRAARA